MKLTKALGLTVSVAFAAVMANAGVLSFTCDPNVDSATCAQLNTTIAGQYSTTFSNANANIYIKFGTTGLASSTTGFDNQVTYSQYVGALSAAASGSGDPIQVAAVLALANNDASVYGKGNVDITSALASALGISGDVVGGNTGTTSTGSACTTPGTGGCYNGIITMSNVPGTFYFDDQGGAEPSSAYDFYAAAEHEVDELLGTSSCISTQGAALADGCPGTNTPSAVDLFRYSAPGTLIPDSALSLTPGAYFSYDGGATNGANGKLYNTLDNGDDYADFVSSCPGGPFAVQDAEGCPGTDKGLNILTDGNPEINILNAIGYDLVSSTQAAPEPGTWALLGVGLAAVAGYRRRRRA